MAGVTLCILATVAVVRGHQLASTHGALQVSISDRSDPANPRPLVPATLAFLDSAGDTLAQAAAEPPIGVVYLTSPAMYSCRDVERRAAYSVEARGEWDRCFDRQSRWLMTWVRRAKSVDLVSGSCVIHGAPIVVDKGVDDWWLWWIPLRHIGGPPFTYFLVAIQIDRAHCTLASSSEIRTPS